MKCNKFLIFFYTKKQSKLYTFDELNPHACGFILSKCYPFTDFNGVYTIAKVTVAKEHSKHQTRRVDFFECAMV